MNGKWLEVTAFSKTFGDEMYVLEERASNVHDLKKLSLPLVIPFDWLVPVRE
jgi:hypothetical protein